MSGKLKKRTNWELKFNGMNSIYNEDGTLNYDLFVDLDLDAVNDAIKKARQRGWGSVNIKGRNYTLYKKENGNILKEDPITDFDPELKYSEGLLAVYIWNNRNNPDALAATNNYAVGYSPAATSTVEEPTEVELPVVETSTIVNPSENRYSGLLDKINDMMPSKGRNSKLRTQYNLLFGDSPENYLNSDSMSGYINRYYGHGWDTGKIKDDLQLTADFVSRNGDLVTDRRGKGEDYLVMESSRLNRDLGGYEGLTYRNLINFLNRENFDQYGTNGRYSNYDDFYKRLYNLSASRNGIQGGELDDLFGKEYGDILTKIAQELGIKGYLQGGVIKMLFI